MPCPFRNFQMSAYGGSICIVVLWAVLGSWTIASITVRVSWIHLDRDSFRIYFNNSVIFYATYGEFP